MYGSIRFAPAARAGDVGGRCGRRVAAGDQELFQPADLPTRHPLPDLGKGRIEPPVKADHDGGAQPLDLLPAGVDPGQVQVDRLLAEHRLAGLGARGEQVDVGRRGRGDDDRVDARVAQDRPGILRRCRAVQRGDLVRRDLDRIVHDGKLGARVRRQRSGVHAADPPGAEQTETQHQASCGWCMAMLITCRPPAEGGVPLAS
jgi:hypothetical protein